MAIEILVVATILLVSVSLILEETQTDIYRPLRGATNKAFLWAGEKTFLGQVVKKGIEVRKEEIKKAEIESYREKIKAMFHARGMKNVTVFGGDYDWNPVTVYIKRDQLHEARQVMRLVLGKWNDKVEPGSCDEEGWGEDRKHMLTVYYVPPYKKEMKYPTRITTKYEIDDLPAGLLKEGCEVIREETVKVSCSVRCAA